MVLDHINHIIPVRNCIHPTKVTKYLVALCWFIVQKFCHLIQATKKEKWTLDSVILIFCVLPTVCNLLSLQHALQSLC